MAQVFPPIVNTVSRVTVLGAVFLLGGALWLSAAVYRSPYVSRAGVTRSQPVAFSHRTHVGGLGLDCRYCHAHVEESASAGLPSTKTCMGCHSQILAKSPILEPVRESYDSDLPIPWTRVHDLPDFVRFDHSIHVRKGVGCSSCHGRIDQMPLVSQGSSLQMDWCLSCHRHPEESLRSVDEVFDPAWRPPADQEIRGRDLLSKGSIRSEPLTDCSICHQ